MKRLASIVVAIGICFPAATMAGGAFTSNHPEEAYPHTAPALTSGGPFEHLLKQVQEKLVANGFDAGAPDGSFNSKTQAALVQFQLSRLIPASGALDDATLAELGVERTTSAPAPAAGG